MKNKGGTSALLPIYKHISPILDERSSQENKHAIVTTSESKEILLFAFGLSQGSPKPSARTYKVRGLLGSELQSWR